MSTPDRQPGEQLDELLQEFVRVANATAAAVEPAGYNEQLQAITDAAKDLFSAGACSLALLDDNGAYLVYRVASGAGAAEIVGQRVPYGQGLTGWVVSSGMPLSLDDVANDPRWQRAVAESTGYVPRSLLAMPLETDRAVLGAISVLDRTMPATPEEAQREMVLLGLFARQAALAIEGAKVFRSAGRFLLSAVAEAAQGESLKDVLDRAVEQATVEDATLSEVARLLAVLNQSDTDLANVVAGALEMVADYVRYRERL